MSNFTFHEFIKTNHSEQNFPCDMQHVENLVCLWQYLEEIRDAFGEPIYINSAFRTPVVNHLVGGVPTSMHLVGRAADIRPEYNKDFYDELSRLAGIIRLSADDLSEFIVYKDFIHIAV